MSQFSQNQPTPYIALLLTTAKKLFSQLVFVIIFFSEALLFNLLFTWMIPNTPAHEYMLAPTMQFTPLFLATSTLSFIIITWLWIMYKRRMDLKKLLFVVVMLCVHDNSVCSFSKFIWWNCGGFFLNLSCFDWNNENL